MKAMAKSSDEHLTRWLVGACLVMLLMLPQASVAQQGTAKAASSNVSKPEMALLPSPAQGAVPARSAAHAEEKELPKPQKPEGEGVRVHGHWVIDVRNPDGTLVEHRDFQNALTTGGAAGLTAYSTGDQILVALLSGNGVASPPVIGFIQGQNGVATLNGVGDPTKFCITNIAGVTCAAWGAANTLFSTAILGLNLTTNFSPTASWVLSGNYTVPAGLTSIDAVETFMALCMGPNLSAITSAIKGTAGEDTGTTTPAACPTTTPTSTSNLLFGALTYTIVNNAGVSQPLAVTPGQVLTVIVTISFS